MSEKQRCLGIKLDGTQCKINVNITDSKYCYHHKDQDSNPPKKLISPKQKEKKPISPKPKEKKPISPKQKEKTPSIEDFPSVPEYNLEHKIGSEQRYLDDLKYFNGIIKWIQHGYKDGKLLIMIEKLKIDNNSLLKTIISKVNDLNISVRLLGLKDKYVKVYVKQVSVLTEIIDKYLNDVIKSTSEKESIKLTIDLLTQYNKIIKLIGTNLSS